MKVENKKYFKLPKEVTLKWLEALRRGKYSQTRGRLISWIYDNAKDVYVLQDPKKGCCLGILGLVCEVPPENMIGCDMPSDVNFIKDKSNKYPKELLIDNLEEVLNLQDILAAMNDGVADSTIKQVKRQYPDLELEEREYSFKEIADWIERNVELYEEV